jgi:NAD(P) transhydrogenase subunit beta
MVELLYMAAAALFIFGLKMLGSPRTARRGNMYAAAGMFLAIIVTLVNEDMLSWSIIIAGIVVGGAIGAVLALRVKMTAMPELVAAFNGFGGAASALVALAELDRNGAELPVEIAAVVAASLAVGSVTFSGSFIAFGKLQGALPGRPLALPGQHVINAAMAVAILALSVLGAAAGIVAPYWIIVAVALVLGVFGVLPIGGADMPVVISLLNSLSGVAASMAGFIIGNSALIIGGALVGAAGFILTVQMGEAMNRTLGNVLFSGFGSTVAGAGELSDKPVNRATADDVAIALGYADSVIRLLDPPGRRADAGPHERPSRRGGRALRATARSRPIEPALPADGCRADRRRQRRSEPVSP